jgi:hypothetical protein
MRIIKKIFKSEKFPNTLKILIEVIYLLLSDLYEIFKRNMWIFH